MKPEPSSDRLRLRSRSWRRLRGLCFRGSESVIEAVIRESREEIGVAIAPADVRFSHVMHNSSPGGRIAFFFTVRNWHGVPANLEPDKCNELRWFSAGALPDRMTAAQR
ncbi:NUDIX domain-containing protein [Nocardia gipuzkoensis]